MSASPAPYRGRFAPSPTGLLHAGSLVAALASWLDARAAQGQWLVRLEDVDTPRCIPGADQTILHQLERCGLHPDAPPVWQSQRGALYQTALDALCAQGLAYPCACSRKEIEEAHTARGHAKERHAALPYPGTCRTGLHGRPARAWRFHTESFIEKHPPGRAETAQKAINSIASNTLIWHDQDKVKKALDTATEARERTNRHLDSLAANITSVSLKRPSTNN